MVIKMTAIKAKPRHPGFIMPAMSKGMAEGGAVLKAAAEGVVSTWNNPPRFETRVFLGPSPETGIICTVTTEDLRWLWLDKGTGKWGPSGQPYPITAKPGRVLAFPSVFQPKSQPNSLKASSGGSGPVDTFRAHVMHPGIEPRNFTKTIHKRYHSDFKRAVSEAIAKWARKK